MEWGVRAFVEFEPNRVLCYDPVMGRSYCPETKGYLTENKVKMHIEINADGLLGKAYPVNRFSEKYRIAFEKAMTTKVMALVDAFVDGTIKSDKDNLRESRQLQNMEFSKIECPWEAPKEVLEQAGVELGKNYPEPIVDLKISRELALEAFATTKKDINE